MNPTKERNLQTDFPDTPPESRTLTIDELAYCSGTTTLLIRQMVEEELISPVTGEESNPRFDVHAVRRIVKALRLHGHLGVELQSLTLVMQLLDRIESLEEELRRIKKM